MNHSKNYSAERKDENILSLRAHNTFIDIYIRVYSMAPIYIMFDIKF